MKTCNVCNKTKPRVFFKSKKKTCRGCERTLGNYLMRMLVKSRKLTPAERIGNRLGYMGTAFIMMSPYLLPYDNIGAYTYLCGAILSLPQVWLAKQWNLVLINLNLLIGYGIFLFGQMAEKINQFEDYQYQYIERILKWYAKEKTANYIKVSWLSGMLKKQHYDEHEKRMLNKMVNNYNSKTIKNEKSSSRNLY